MLSLLLKLDFLFFQALELLDKWCRFLLDNVERLDPFVISVLERIDLGNVVFVLVLLVLELLRKSILETEEWIRR